MAQYIDFIRTMHNNRALASEFKQMIKKSSPEELSGWFSLKGYHVSYYECSIILANNKNNCFLMEEAIPYLFIKK